jgi:hypothetical protein
MCHGSPPGGGGFVSGSTNLTFTDNVIGCDLLNANGRVYSNETTAFTHASNPTNNWARNKINSLPFGGNGTGWTNGNFLWPDGTDSAGDFPG